MDSSQDNNFGNTTPSEGGVGGVPKNDEVSVGLGMGAGDVSVNPVQSSQPVSSTNPVQGMTPVEQTNPVMPANSVQSTVSASPMQPIISDNTQPAAPMSSVQPAASVNLAQPTIPVGQAQPAMPVNPMQSTMPMEQANPITSNGFEQQMSPMGMNINMMNPSMPMSSDTGDIILNVDDKKRFKRGWIVGVVLGLIVITVVAMVIVKPWELNGGNSSGISDTIEGKFNIYANYYLFGRQGDASGLKSDIEVEIPFFNYDSYLNDSQGLYLETLKGYYDRFYDSFVLDESYTIAEKSLVNSYRDMLYFLIAYRSNDLTRNEITRVYIEYGEDSVKDLISKKTSPFFELNAIYETRYYDLFKRWSDETLLLVKEYNESGCVDGGTINYDCMAENKMVAIEERMDRISGYYRQMQAIVKSCETGLYDGVFGINEVIKEKKEDEENG